jgi:hypothetical protein
MKFRLSPAATIRCLARSCADQRKDDQGEGGQSEKHATGSFMRRGSLHPHPLSERTHEIDTTIIAEEPPAWSLHERKRLRDSSSHRLRRLQAARPLQKHPPSANSQREWARQSRHPDVDLRLWLGMPSFPEGVDNFCTTLGKREQDHRNWLNELEASVVEERDFRLTTDPHACAFGRWYDNCQAEDPWLIAALRRFDAPHKRIHAIGTSVTRLMKNGEREKAQALISQTRNGDLAEMIKLFAEFQEKLRETMTETAVVLATGDGACVAAVDLVAA